MKLSVLGRRGALTWNWPAETISKQYAVDRGSSGALRFVAREPVADNFRSSASSGSNGGPSDIRISVPKPGLFSGGQSEARVRSSSRSRSPRPPGCKAGGNTAQYATTVRDHDSAGCRDLRPGQDDSLLSSYPNCPRR